MQTALLLDVQSPTPNNPSLAFWWKWAIIGASGIGGLWIRTPHSIQILLMVMGLDVISGVFASVVHKSASSTSFVRGVFTKLAVFPLLALLHLCEEPLNLPFEFESIAAVAFIMYEAMSIVENCARAGVPIPAVIVTTLAKAKIKTISPDDIRKEFAGDSRTVSVQDKSEIVKTPDDVPDMMVTTKETLLVEKHVEPIPPGEA